MGKRSYRHIILDPYAYSKHSILQQMQHFLATIQRMTEEVLVPNMLQGMQRPGWTNTDLLHMYQVLTQVDHLLRWGGARNQSIKMEATFKFHHKPTLKSNKELEIDEVDDEEEDEEDLDEEDEEEEEVGEVGDNDKTSASASDLNKVLETFDCLSMDEASSGISSNAICPPSNASVHSEAKRKEDDQQSDSSKSNHSKIKDANNNLKEGGEDSFIFDSLVIRCRSCRSSRTSHSDQCKRCVRSLMRMRKRMMKKSTRLVRRIVKTHHSAISQIFSHSRSTSDRKSSSPLDQHLHERLEFHLQQLTCILDAFAESAEQITKRYQLLINA